MASILLRRRRLTLVDVQCSLNCPGCGKLLNRVSQCRHISSCSRPSDRALYVRKIREYKNLRAGAYRELDQALGGLLAQRRRRTARHDLEERSPSTILPSSFSRNSGVTVNGVPNNTLEEGEIRDCDINDPKSQIYDNAAGDNGWRMPGRQQSHHSMTITSLVLNSSATDRRARILTVHTADCVNTEVPMAMAMAIADFEPEPFAPECAIKSIRRTGTFVLQDSATGSLVYSFICSGFPIKTASGLEFLAKTSVYREV